ncbi:MAG: S41 family peptidase [Sedimentisphaerales bacterium]|nr:S41 family peptidase [Sedimentisphaerales bacterium]
MPYDRNEIGILFINTLIGRMRGSRQFRFFCIIPFLLAVTILLSVKINSSPAFTFARDDQVLSLEELLKQADAAMAGSAWENAQDYFQKALIQADDSSKDYIQDRLQWCNANTSLEKRYEDETLARYIRQTGPEEALDLLTLVLEHIRNNFYEAENLDTKQLLQDSLLQLQAATENPAIYGQFQIKPQDLALLTREIISLRHNLDARGALDFESLPVMLDQLCRQSSQAGLGFSWPVLELAWSFTDNLDQYSYILTPQQYEIFSDRLSGFYVGTGLDLIFPGDYPVVFDVVPDGPAQTAGVQPGDILIKIDNTDGRGLSPAQVSKLLLGSPNTKVTIIVKRDTQELTLIVKRQLVESPSVRYVRMLDEQIGFLRVASFDHDTAMEMRRAIDKLKKRGARSLIIDLRCNGGGVMDSAIDAVRLFIDSGTIVTVSSSHETTRYSAGGDYFHPYDMPLVICVDKKTASAAEIFTAALQDHHRGVVVGRKTLGKAVIQTIFSLKPHLSAICITTSRYLPPDNNDFHRIGLDPDITIESNTTDSSIPDSVKYYLDPHNPTLTEAVNQLKQPIQL